MALLNWSMTILGYSAHARTASRVVGLTHMSTHDALHFIEVQGLSTGWLQVEGSQPQLERIREGTRVDVNLPELFASSKIIQTEGVASGALTFVAADPKLGKPPSDRTMITWAEELHRPWLEVIDNDVAYFGGLDNAQIDTLLRWYLARRPADLDWRKTVLDPRLAARLRQGLFDHGWTRNLELVKVSRKTFCDLWGGVHRKCLLDHAAIPGPMQVQIGLRLCHENGTWTGKDISDQRCVLNDDTGKLTFGSGYYKP
ncbi:MAG TPA: hypothetical protein VHX44_05505 [Planctomycetota bacterium]|nr:hypothetical protein [Planctomycetota bacterium]